MSKLKGKKKKTHRTKELSSAIGFFPLFSFRSPTLTPFLLAFRLPLSYSLARHSMLSRTSSDIPTDMIEKRSNQSLYGRHDMYDGDSGYDRSSFYSEDEPMSSEEKALVRKIDFFILPFICIINLLQVHLSLRPINISFRSIHAKEATFNLHKSPFSYSLSINPPSTMPP